MDQPQQVHPPASYVTIAPPATADGYQPPAAPTNPPAPQSRYKQGAARTTGFIQIFCGLSSMIFGCIVLLVLFGVVKERNVHFGHVIFGIVSWPLWSGLIYLIAGSLGASAKAENRCLITGYMVMSIIAAMFAFGQMIWEIMAVFVTKCYDYYHHDYDYDWSGWYDEDYCGAQISHGMHIGAAVVAVLELIAAITGSVFGCVAMCCGTQATQTQTVQVQYHHYPTPGAPNIVHPTAPAQMSTNVYPELPLYTPGQGYSTNNSGFTPDYTPSAPDQSFMDTELPGK